MGLVLKVYGSSLSYNYFIFNFSHKVWTNVLKTCSIFRKTITPNFKIYHIINAIYNKTVAFIKGHN